MRQNIFKIVFLIVLFTLGFYLIRQGINKIIVKKIAVSNKLPSVTTPNPTPTPIPTPKPLTFAEMNALYGPCVYLPTLMYHHVQNMDEAKKKNQQNLTVDTEFFRKQMQYLKSKNYSVATMSDLISFFEGNVIIPKKSVLITFDDGYDDFYLNALPILKEFGYKATVFIPTGLMDNPNYLLWVQITDAAGGGILFANHTWSHKNMKQLKDIVEKEIIRADTQLNDKGLNSPKVFAYPYGFSSVGSEELLTKLGYKLAFTTIHGGTLCKKQKFDLPRIRIGNGELSAYGL